MGRRLWKTHSSKTLCGDMNGTLSSCLATPNKKVWAADARYFHEWIHKKRARARSRIRASERRWISRAARAERAPNDVRRWVSIFIVRAVLYTFVHAHCEYVAWCGVKLHGSSDMQNILKQNAVIRRTRREAFREKGLFAFVVRRFSNAVWAAHLCKWHLFFTVTSEQAKWMELLKN